MRRYKIASLPFLVCCLVPISGLNGLILKIHKFCLIWAKLSSFLLSMCRKVSRHHGSGAAPTQLGRIYGVRQNSHDVLYQLSGFNGLAL